MSEKLDLAHKYMEQANELIQMADKLIEEDRKDLIHQIHESFK